MATGSPSIASSPMARGRSLSPGLGPQVVNLRLACFDPGIARCDADVGVVGEEAVQAEVQEQLDFACKITLLTQVRGVGWVAAAELVLQERVLHPEGPACTIRPLACES